MNDPDALPEFDMPRIKPPTGTNGTPTPLQSETAPKRNVESMADIPEKTLGIYELNSVHNTDALTLLRGLPDESISLVVTSPPYNLRNSTGNGLKAQNDKNFWRNQPLRHGYAGEYADDLPHDEYIDWQRSVLVECMRILKPAGAMFYNHKWRVQDGLLQRLADDITAGFPVRQIIIWSRTGGINFNDGYFLPSYEVIYLIAKSDFELQPGTNVFMDVWDIRPSQRKDHPDSFPETLVERCILAGSTIDEIVLDSFMGSGTTAAVAQRLGRQFIGCDISAEYCEQACKRIALPYTTPLFESL